MTAVDPGRGAIISGCETYRWRLWRRWDPTLPRVVWIMLNPSTADHENDDPTIRRCIGFAKSWGYGGIEVVNLFPYRATAPTDLWQARRAGIDIVAHGYRNGHIADAVLQADSSGARTGIIAAWGAANVGDEPRTLPWICRPLMCLGTTKSGAPRHPLYVKGDTEPIPWIKP